MALNPDLSTPKRIITTLARIYGADSAPLGHWQQDPRCKTVGCFSPPAWRRTSRVACFISALASTASSGSTLMPMLAGDLKLGTGQAQGLPISVRSFFETVSPAARS